MVVENSVNSQLLSNFPNLINSLVQLHNYKIKEFIDEQNVQEAHEIREYSGYCLSSVQEYGDNKAQIILLNGGYAKSLSLNVALAGGLLEMDTSKIAGSYSELALLARSIFQGRESDDDFKIPSLDPQPFLIKEVEEQIEEEGCFEEVDVWNYSEQFNEENSPWNYNVEKELLNIFHDTTNK
ncbi:MAG: hypothetical protein EZS28_035464 [Streblomastix strix]|uniref:Uncharacterized protein n=1 Tax=Streblomastix strix TaxID=222440 RepID=A0A5J4UEG4_9EUKA|nr:MAG: hypothetical protein EZS28_035464 [Streblomastix strix]